MNSNDVFIVSASRTPIGNFRGTLTGTSAADLGAVVIREVLKRANVEGKDVDEVIMGQALTAGTGQNPAKQAAWNAGVPKEVPAYVISMLCGSGLKSVAQAYVNIKVGEAKVIVCGGQESMTMSPHTIFLRNGVKMGPGTMMDSLLHDGLTDAMFNIHMGETAENVQKQFNISREDQDAQAAKSQQLAKTAQEKGYFKDEIVPVPIKDNKGNVTYFTEDEYIKGDSTVEKLAKLRPVFIKNGTVTAGNASGVNDSAAAVLVMSGEEATKRSIKPLARIVAIATTGCDPQTMGLGPIGSVTQVLKKANWTKEEVDAYELNEAFAAQALAVVRELKIDPSKVNMHGGAIALGHPIGASGCRVLVTLIHVLKRIGGKKGVASLCIGGGMGIAMAIEMQ